MPPTAPPTAAPVLILCLPVAASRAATVALALADGDETYGMATLVTSATDVAMPLTVVHVSTEDGGSVRVDYPVLELEPEPGAELDGRLDVSLARLEDPGGVVPGELDSAGLVLSSAAGVMRVRVLLYLNDITAFS